MTVVKTAKEMFQEARKGTENLTCLEQKLLLNVSNYGKAKEAIQQLFPRVKAKK